MKTSLLGSSLESVFQSLKSANSEMNSLYPGDSSLRQPVHTVYGGAHLFQANTAKKMSELALQALRTYAPEPSILAQALGWNETNPWTTRVYQRVLDKLQREAVEDFRIDFEDGYGNRPDSEEDQHAVSAAQEVARGAMENTLPPFIGIRIKPLTDELMGRSLRTLDLFVTTLAEQARGKFPKNFLVTLPKITSSEQVHELARVLKMLESHLKLTENSLKIELMIETTQSIFAPSGEASLPQFISASQGRCTGAHFGTYDYTASCNITAAHQHMMHPACDFAKNVMQVTLAGTGIFLSDGATNVMPVGPHRASPGSSLTPQQFKENQLSVHRAWKLNYDHVRHSLIQGFYQGWDLHPAQLPIRYAGIYLFFLENLEASSLRLKTFMEKAAQATLLGDVFDDAATGQGLLNFFLRGIGCGAITEEEAIKTGLTLEEIQGRSFYKILKNRRSQNK